jgi:hypothetical protein
MATAVRRPPPQAVGAAIMEATIRLMVRDGVDGVVQRAVAGDAGVSPVVDHLPGHVARGDRLVTAPRPGFERRTRPVIERVLSIVMAP